MEVGDRKNQRAKAVIFAVHSRKTGSDSGRRRLRTRRLAATLSEPTLAGARGTENQKYHTTVPDTMPLWKITEKVVRDVVGFQTKYEPEPEAPDGGTSILDFSCCFSSTCRADRISTSRPNSQMSAVRCQLHSSLCFSVLEPRPLGIHLHGVLCPPIANALTGHGTRYADMNQTAAR